MSLRMSLLLVVAGLPLARVSAQPHRHQTSEVASDTSAARFVAWARAAIVRYQDRATAIGDGYHQVGPDLPAMGEHWLNIGLILADTVDAAHPPVLIYVPSPNGPVLAGVAYTRLLSRRDSYPDFPRGLHAWHEHSGLIEDEALPMAHSGHTSSTAAVNTRLGIMHLWIGVENPAGEWIADNWALPFVRAGLRVSSQSDFAARSVALTADSGRYYVGVLTSVGQLDSTEAHQARAILAGAAATARAVVSRGNGMLTDPDLEQLDRIWKEVALQLGVALSKDATTRLRELCALWWGTPQGFLANER